MFCVNCGKLLKSDEKFCVNCGQKVEDINNNPINDVDKKVKNNSEKKYIDGLTIILVIISFFIPLIGVILCITLRKNNKERANSCGVSALTSVFIFFLIGFVIVVYMFGYLWLHIEDFNVYGNNTEQNYYELEEFVDFQSDLDSYSKESIL